MFVTDQTDAEALALISVLSLPYIVDRLAPRLNAAVDGDPSTRGSPIKRQPRATEGELTLRGCVSNRAPQADHPVANPGLDRAERQT